MDRDQKLAQVLVEFAHTLGTDFSIQSILDHLVLRIVDVLPVTGAGVMLMARDEENLHFVAASNAKVLEIESLQNELGEGPCLEAYRTNEAVAIPDLANDHRFPEFSAGARSKGLAAVFTFPMRLDKHRLGALDLYRDTPGQLDDEDMQAAQVLADVAAAYLFNAQARSDTLASAEMAQHRSLHDPLTGLPNRTLLSERLEHAVARARRPNQVVAVLFVDLDRFKSINDRFGHHVGDLLLIEVASRLRHVLRPGDTLARLAGDEFVVLCEDLGAPDQAEVVAERIVATLGEPMSIVGHRIEVTASVGLAFSGPGVDVPQSLLHDADFAMYQVKRAGGARHQVIDNTARRVADHHQDLEDDLRAALTRAEFALAYQPIADADGALVGVEALLRWRHPERGWILPGTVLPIAERSGLIVPLGEWVLRQAFRDFARWDRTHSGAIAHLTVNVSARQVSNPDFATIVSEALSESKINPSEVTLELTETMFLGNTPRAPGVLHDLRALGVELSLDDFGTGYSCLAYLKRFPFSMVKIDRSFIADIASSGTRTIVAAIISLAHELNLTVIAEGVESVQQLEQVMSLGADCMQGFFLGRPLTFEEFNELLEHSDPTVIRLPIGDNASLTSW